MYNSMILMDQIQGCRYYLSNVGETWSFSASVFFFFYEHVMQYNIMCIYMYLFNYLLKE